MILHHEYLSTVLFWIMSDIATSSSNWRWKWNANSFMLHLKSLRNHFKWHAGLVMGDSWLKTNSRTALAFPSPAYTPGYFGCDCTNWYLEVDCGSSVTCCRLIIDLVHRACKSCVSCSSSVWMFSKAWGWWETELNMCVLQKQSLCIYILHD